MMRIMDQKKLITILGIVIVIVSIGTGILVWEKSVLPEQTTQVTEQPKQPVKTTEIESVKDLVDSEYSFASVDTSDWQMYQDTDTGFEVKIPKGWKLVDTYKDDSIKGNYLYFGQDGTTYSIPEGGTSNAAILVLASDRNNGKAMPLKDFLQKRKSGYGERISSLLIDQVDAVMIGETSARFFEGDKAWAISLQLYYDRDNDIHVNEHDVFLGMVKTFRFLK